MTNPVSGGDSFHSRALILHPKFQKQAKYDALVKRSFELQKAEVRLLPLVGRVSVLACNSESGVSLKTSGVQVFIPEEATSLLRNFSRLTCANQYLSKLRKCDHFSGVILVGSGTKPFVEAAFQPTTIDQPAFDSSTPFNIQSVGKLFTQVAIFQLIESGAFELDTPIAEILTEDAHYAMPVEVLRLSPEAIHGLKTSQVTIRDLLKHQAGLEGGVNVPKNKPAPLVTFDPTSVGTVSYSNTGFALLAKITEQTTGRTFTDYVRENIFKRSGISEEDSIRFLDQPPSNHEMPVGFDSLSPSGDIIADDSPYQSPYGNGCFWMIPADLYKFGQALQSGRLFQDSRGMKEQMLSVMEVSVDQNGRSYGHQGGAINGSTDFTIIEPADGAPAIISIVMSNFSGGSDAGIELKIAIKDQDVLPPLGPQMDDIHFVKAILAEESLQKREKLLHHFFERFPPFGVAMRMCDVFVEKNREDLLLEFIPFLLKNEAMKPMLEEFSKNLSEQGNQNLSEKVTSLL